MMMTTTTLSLERPLRLPLPRLCRTHSRNLSRQNKVSPTLTVTIERAAIIIDRASLRVDAIATTIGTDIMTEEIIEVLGKEATDTTISLRAAMETGITTETVIIIETGMALISTASMTDPASLENQGSKSITTPTTGSTIATTPLSSLESLRRKKLHLNLRFTCSARRAILRRSRLKKIPQSQRSSETRMNWKCTRFCLIMMLRIFALKLLPGIRRRMISMLVRLSLRTRPGLISTSTRRKMR